MADAYDMRSNIKGKPGSQGTLFQVKDTGLLNPQQRWPQGYTPERLNDVREGLKAVPVSAPDHMYSQPSDETQKMHGVNEYGYRERVTREIAKTTIPAEHLHGLKGIDGEPDEGTHGTYWKGGPKDRTLAVDLTAASPDETRKTLTHEIGHHVNMSLAPTPHVHELAAQIHAYRSIEGNEYRTTPTQTDFHMAKSRTRAGVDEAQADDYMVEHYRTGGRKSTGVTKGAYEETFTSDDRARQYPGYNDVRPPTPSPTLQMMQFNDNNPGLFPREQGKGHSPEVGSSELRRRLAQEDATRRAVGENLPSRSGPPQRRLAARANANQHAIGDNL